MTQLAHRKTNHYDWEDVEPFERDDHTWDVRASTAHVSVFRIPERRSDWLRSAQDVEKNFFTYATEWREASASSSVAATTFMHPAYQRIIGLGPAALPLIIEELRREVDHWFWALAAIVGRDVAPEAASLKQAAQAWIEWYDNGRP